jgi:hypothetical protein
MSEIYQKIEKIMKMKISTLILLTQLYSSVLFAQNLQLNQTYSNDTVLYLFNNETIGSLKLNALIKLDSENSLIRVILVDTDLHEWLVYETYSQIIENNTTSFINEADETEFLSNIHPKFIKIQTVEASLSISSFVLGAPLKSDNEQMTANNRIALKQRKNKEKINQLNNVLKKMEKNGWLVKLGFQTYLMKGKRKLLVMINLT